MRLQQQCGTKNSEQYIFKKHECMLTRILCFCFASWTSLLVIWLFYWRYPFQVYSGIRSQWHFVDITFRYVEALLLQVNGDTWTSKIQSKRGNNGTCKASKQSQQATALVKPARARRQATRSGLATYPGHDSSAEHKGSCSVWTFLSRNWPHHAEYAGFVVFGPWTHFLFCLRCLQRCVLRKFPSPSFWLSFF